MKENNTYQEFITLPKNVLSITFSISAYGFNTVSYTLFGAGNVLLFTSGMLKGGSDHILEPISKTCDEMSKKVDENYGSQDSNLKNYSLDTLSYGLKGLSWIATGFSTTCKVGHNLTKIAGNLCYTTSEKVVSPLAKTFHKVSENLSSKNDEAVVPQQLENSQVVNLQQFSKDLKELEIRNRTSGV